MNNQIRVLIADANEGFTAQLSGFLGENPAFVVAGVANDGEKAVEDAVLASGADVHADVFKAAHHGSSTSNPQAFLDAVRPQAVVVSCGAGNSYGHPHSEALAAFANVGAQVYRTDTEGTIIAYVDKAGALQMAVSRQEAA